VSDEFVNRDFNCRLLQVLRRLEGEEGVTVRTVGQFQFNAEGRLARVEDRLALLTDVAVFPPGLDYSFRLSNVTINICAITSIGQGC